MPWSLARIENDQARQMGYAHNNELMWTRLLVRLPDFIKIFDTSLPQSITPGEIKKREELENLCREARKMYWDLMYKIPLDFRTKREFANRIGIFEYDIISGGSIVDYASDISFKHPEFLLYLLKERKADPSQYAPSVKGDIIAGPLHRALWDIRRDNAGGADARGFIAVNELIKRIKRKKRKIEIDHPNAPPLVFATMNDYDGFVSLPLLELLYKNGANLNAKWKRGLTAKEPHTFLHVVCENLAANGGVDQIKSGSSYAKAAMYLAARGCDFGKGLDPTIVNAIKENVISAHLKPNRPPGVGCKRATRRLHARLFS